MPKIARALGKVLGHIGLRRMNGGMPASIMKKAV
jgi:hypothetical protein